MKTHTRDLQRCLDSAEVLCEATLSLLEQAGAYLDELENDDLDCDYWQARNSIVRLLSAIDEAEVMKTHV